MAALRPAARAEPPLFPTRPTRPAWHQPAARAAAVPLAAAVVAAAAAVASSSSSSSSSSAAAAAAAVRVASWRAWPWPCARRRDRSSRFEAAPRAGWDRSASPARAVAWVLRSCPPRLRSRSHGQRLQRHRHHRRREPPPSPPLAQPQLLRREPPCCALRGGKAPATPWPGVVRVRVTVRVS